MSLQTYRGAREYLDFISSYAAAKNAASASVVDANANVELKNISTMESELFKKEAIKLNRLAMHDRITELFGEELADQYISDLENHVIYRHDETKTIGFPYCASITLYPFLLRGLKDFGGSSAPPKNLSSYCGGFINLCFAVASELAGAVATPEFLPYMDYFIRMEYGDDYYTHTDKIVDLSNKRRTIDKIITGAFQQVVYSLNQPAAARGSQSIFWNIA